jgi:uncharacterized lipoprotein YajG
MDMASIRASRPVDEIVRSAVEAEFRQRGFSIQADGRKVQVSVNTFYNTFQTGVFAGGATGDVQLSIAVSANPGAPTFRQTYAGVSNSTIMLANGSNAAESVAKALQDALRRMFADPAFLAAVSSRPVT